MHHGVAERGVSIRNMTSILRVMYPDVRIFRVRVRLCLVPAKLRVPSSCKDTPDPPPPPAASEAPPPPPATPPVSEGEEETCFATPLLFLRTGAENQPRKRFARGSL